MPNRDDEALRREVAYLVWKRMTRTAAILGLVNTALALLLAFGVSVTESQQAAIVAFVNALLFVGAAFIDPKVPWGVNQGEQIK